MIQQQIPLLEIQHQVQQISLKFKMILNRPLIQETPMQALILHQQNLKQIQQIMEQLNKNLNHHLYKTKTKLLLKIIPKLNRIQHKLMLQAQQEVNHHQQHGSGSH
jgi:hypothetical protein